VPLLLKQYGSLALKLNLFIRLTGGMNRLSSASSNNSPITSNVDCLGK
jgi:hypothetical protein